MEDHDKSTLIGLTAEIASAFVSNNAVRPDDMPGLLASLHGALAGLGVPPAEPVVEPLKPAISIKKSVTDEYIVSLEDGRKFKSLKRHLSGLGMTPDAYRRKWGLPHDYPMVAPAYGKARSELAKTIGLGRKKMPVLEPAAGPAKEPTNKRGRPKKAA